MNVKELPKHCKKLCWKNAEHENHQLKAEEIRELRGKRCRKQCAFDSNLCASFFPCLCIKLASIFLSGKSFIESHGIEQSYLVIPENWIILVMSSQNQVVSRFLSSFELSWLQELFSKEIMKILKSIIKKHELFQVSAGYLRSCLACLGDSKTLKRKLNWPRASKSFEIKKISRFLNSFELSHWKDETLNDLNLDCTCHIRNLLFFMFEV